MVVYNVRFAFEHPYFEDKMESNAPYSRGMGTKAAKALFATSEIPNLDKFKIDPIRNNSLGRTPTYEPHAIFADGEPIPLVNPNDAFEFEHASNYSDKTPEFMEVAWDLRQMIAFVNFMLDFAKGQKFRISSACLVHFESRSVCTITNNIVTEWFTGRADEDFASTAARVLRESKLRDERRKEFIEYMEDQLKSLRRWELVDFIKDIFLKNEGLLSEVVQRSFTTPLVQHVVEQIVNPLLSNNTSAGLNLPSKCAREEKKEEGDDQIPPELKALENASVRINFIDVHEA